MNPRSPQPRPRGQPPLSGSITHRRPAKLVKQPPSCIWNKALEKARAMVGAPEYARMSQGSFEKINNVMKELSERYSERPIAAEMLRLEPFLSNLKIFENTISIFCQAKPEIACLVWGSLHAFIIITVRYADIFHTIVDMLCGAMDIWPRFGDYRALFPDNKRIEDRIAKFYNHYIQFCVETVKFFSHRPLSAMVRLSWSRVQSRFDTLKGKMKECQDFLAHEAQAADMIESKRFRDEFTEILKRESSPQEADLPFRRVQIARNPQYFRRQDVFSSIDEKIANAQSGSNAGLVSILLHGLGGAGKTQAAAHYAYDHWQEYEAILWVGADTPAKLASDYFDAAKDLNLCDDTDRRAGIAALKKWLENKNVAWLMIFDNVDEANQLLDYWPGRGARGVILATSRGPLRGASIFNHEISLPILSEDESTTMLKYVLPLDNTSSLLDTVKVSSIAARLYGLPLAITQMAGYISQTGITLENFLEMYKQKNKYIELRRISRNVDPAQYRFTLDTVFSVSFEKLSPEARMLLDLCAMLDPDNIPEQIFSNASSTDPQLSWMCNEVNFNLAVSDLLGHTLLSRRAEAQSFSIHREVQQSAIEALAKKGSNVLTEAASRLMRLLYDKFPRQSPIGEPIPHWDRCETYVKHILHVDRMFFQEHLQAKASTETMKIISELYCDCGVYLWARGLLTEAEQLARKSIKLADQVFDPHDCLRAQPRTLLGCVMMGLENGNAEAMECLEKALAIHQNNVQSAQSSRQWSLDQHIQLANAYNNLGLVKYQMGDFVASAQLNAQSIAIKRKYPADKMTFLLALSNHNLGVTCAAQGKVKEARRLLTESVQLMQYTEQEMELRKSRFFYSLGDLELRGGNSAEAISNFMKAFRIQQKIEPNGAKTAFTSHQLGVIFYREQEYVGAKILFDNACKVFSSPEYFTSVKKGRSALWLGRSLLALNEKAKSTERIEEAMELYYKFTGSAMSQDLEEASQQYQKIISEGT